MQNLHELREYLKVEELSAFAAVVENNGFIGAGRALARSATVISRRVQRLEEQLGTSLLARSTRHVSLTEAGELIYNRVRNLLDELQNAKLEVSEFAAAPVGNLKLSLPVTFGRRWVTPRLSSFIAAYPGIHLDVRFSDRLVDLVAEGFDLAIRVGHLNDSALLSRTISRFEYSLFASPSYLAKKPVKNPECLGEHSCLGFVNHADWPNWVLKDGHRTVTVRTCGPIQADNSEALLQAAVDGLGIVLVPDWLTIDETRTGKLVSVLPEWKGATAGGVHGIMPPGRLVPAKTRLFLDYIIREIRSEW